MPTNLSAADAALATHPKLAKPIVMSDALSANTLADESGVIRCHCLAHGYRQFDDIDEVLPPT